PRPSPARPPPGRGRVPPGPPRRGGLVPLILAGAHDRRSRRPPAAAGAEPRGPAPPPAPANPRRPSRRPAPGHRRRGRPARGGRPCGPRPPRGGGPSRGQPSSALAPLPPTRSSQRAGAAISSLVGSVSGEVQTRLKVSIPASATTVATNREPW